MVVQYFQHVWDVSDIYTQPMCGASNVRHVKGLLARSEELVEIFSSAMQMENEREKAGRFQDVQGLVSLRPPSQIEVLLEVS